jgi:hypothetical protein
VNCDLKNNKNSTVAKLGMHVENVLCQLSIKYDNIMVSIVASNLPIKFKTTYVQTYAYMSFFRCEELTLEVCPGTLISGFYCNVDEICVFLGYYTELWGNYHTAPHNIPEEHRSLSRHFRYTLHIQCMTKH